MIEEEAKKDGVVTMGYKDVVPNSNTVWYLDLGASSHMNEHKNLFVEMQEIEDGHMSFGDESEIQVKGKGKISFSHNGKESLIVEVYYVPDMKSNILSMGELMEKGSSVFMKDQMMHLKEKGGRTLACVEMAKNVMYKLNMRNMLERCLQVNMTNKTSLWHLRFGRLHYSGLKELAKKGMVHGLLDMDYPKQFCEGCVIGKQARNSFPRRVEYRVRRYLKLITPTYVARSHPINWRKEVLHHFH